MPTPARSAVPFAVATAVLILVATGLGGCAGTGPDPALTAMRSLVGMPKDIVLSCAGVPVRTASMDTREWFTYHSENLRSYGGDVPVGRPWRWGFYDPPELASVSCEATFTFRAGRVDRVDFSSPQGVVGNPQCGAIVTTCLGLVPPQSVIVTPGPGAGGPPPTATPPLPSR